MAARVALSNMRQGHEEPIRSFYARIKGQVTCKYEMNGTIKSRRNDQVNDFTEGILHNMIARGIETKKYNLICLTSKYMIEYIKAKESQKRSASHLLDPQAAGSWVMVRHPCGTPDAQSASRMVKSATNGAARITSKRDA